MKNNKIKAKYIKISLLLLFVNIIVIASFLVLINFVYVSHKQEELVSYLKKNQREPLITINQDAYLLGFKNSIDDSKNEEFSNLEDSKIKLNFKENIAQTGEFIALRHEDDVVYYELSDSINWDFIVILITILIVIIIIFIIYTITAINMTDKLIIKRIYGISKNIANNDDLIEYKSMNNDEIDMLIDSLLKYNLLEEKTIKEKNLLVQAFSHELKTPLQSISAIMYLLDEEIYSINEAVELVEKEILKSKENIEGALNVFNDGNIGLKKVKVNVILKDIEVTCQPIISKKELFVKKNFEKLELIANEEEIKLLINNLFNNAVRHACEKSDVVIELKDGILKIENHYSKIDKNNNTYGNKIINYIVKKNNWIIERKVDEELYIVELKLK